VFTFCWLLPSLPAPAVRWRWLPDLMYYHSAGVLRLAVLCSGCCELRAITCDVCVVCSSDEEEFWQYTAWHVLSLLLGFFSPYTENIENMSHSEKVNDCTFRLYNPARRKI